jgi:hypothetical protein
MDKGTSTGRRHAVRRATTQALARAMAVAAVGLAALLLVHPAPGEGQPAPLEITAEDTVRSVLERSVGRRVELALVSGEKLTGTVKLVNAELVHLAGLQGREFFDAVARIDRIDAIVYRTRTR